MSVRLFLDRIGIWNCWFLTEERGKPEYQEKNLSEQGREPNQWQTQPTYGVHARKNIRALWFKPWPRTLKTHRITPYHVSSGGQDSKCQVDVSQRKYKIGQNKPLKHGQNHARVNFHVVRSVLQYSACRIWYVYFHFCWSGLYRSYVLDGIFVCSPLQSFVVNVCT